MLSQYLILPLLATGAFASIGRRQNAFGFDLSKLGPISGNLAGMFLPKKSAYKIEQIPPQTNIPGTKRIRIVHGPYKLRAANSSTKVGNGFSMDKGGTGYMYMVADDFPKDITILESHSEVQNPQFKRVGTEEGIYNHHNVFMHMQSSSAVYGCEGAGPSKFSMPFTVLSAGATENGFVRYFAEDDVVKSGYYLPKDRQILNQLDVINYNDEEREVYTSTEFEYLPGKAEGYIQSRQYLIDPGLCGGPSGASIHPPKGQSKFSIKTSNLVALKDGWIVNTNGHMHDGGINIVLKVNDEVVCDSRASYGGEGHTATMADGKVWETLRESTKCTKSIPVKKGDKIYMQANYDLELHPSREMGGHKETGHGGMGEGGMSGMKGMMRTISNTLDGEAEQMALMITYFASKEL